MAPHPKQILKRFVLLTKRVPWWVSLAVALILYATLHGIATSSVWEIRQAAGFTRLAATSVRGIAFFAQYLVPALALIGAGLSFFNPKNPHPSDLWTPSDELAGISWSEFELLTAEAFRRLEYRLEQVADRPKGVDLVLKRYGQQYLVHCKHWHAWNMGEQQVRELDALIAAHGAAGGFLVNSGRFTPEAQKYAQSRKIRLIDGDALLEIVPACRMSTPAAISPAATCSQTA